LSFYINSTLREVAAPPIADAQSWVVGRIFPADRPLLDVSQAVPSYAPAPELQSHLAQQVMQPLTALYTGIAGLPELRRELAAELSRDYAGTVTADNVALTAGCNEAFAVAMMALAEAGDEVLLPLPYYFNQQMWLQTLEIDVIEGSRGYKFRDCIHAVILRETAIKSEAMLYISLSRCLSKEERHAQYLKCVIHAGSRFRPADCGAQALPWPYPQANQHDAKIVVPSTGTWRGC